MSNPTAEQRVYVSQGFLHGDGAVRNATIAEQSLAETIVARLRKALETRTWVNLPEDIREACDELERLTAEVERLKEYEWMYKDLCK